MLQAIRDKAQGWIAWVIVILITIPFALFGIHEYLGVGADPVVAEIDGIEITEPELERRIRDTREDLRAQLGGAYDQAMFEGPLFRQQVLSAMVDETVRRQQANNWNMRTSEQQWSAFIQSIPAFMTEGRFDRRLYEAAARNSGQSPEGFAAAVKQDLVMQQLRKGLSGSAFVTQRELNEQVRLVEQKRAIRYAQIEAAKFNQADAVSEDEALAYYEANKPLYRVPERVKLAYVRLNSASLHTLVSDDEAGLLEFYEQNAGRFTVPEERQARHILLLVEGDNEAEQQAQANALLAELRAGADFAELAKAHSQDPGSAEQGGDLGWIAKDGQMVQPFEEAVFALANGAISDPIRTSFGYHLIQVTDVRGGGAFEAVRDQVVQAYRDQQAGDLFFTQVERFTDLAYESSDSLRPLVDELELSLQETDWVSRSGAGLPADLRVPKVINAAFSEEVLQQNLNSHLIELDTTDVVVLRVLEHEPESVKPFEQVKAQVVMAAAKAAAAEKAAAAGAEALSALRDGGDIAELASQSGWSLQSAQIGRDQQDLPVEVTGKAFSLVPPVAGEFAFAGVAIANGDFVVIEVGEVIDGQAVDEEDAVMAMRQQQLQQQRAAADFAGMTTLLRERAGVE